MEPQTLQTLCDRIAIEEVRHWYAQALDDQNWDALPSLFTAQVDTDFSDFGMPPQTVPQEALIASFRQNLSRPGLRTQHVFSSFRIAVAGDAATSVSNFVGYHFLPGFDGGDEFTLRGEYTDTFVRAAQGWQISGVAFQTRLMTGNPKILAG